ncbi:Methionyl-tRNA_synthetase [Hexamita inflata]|uniref:methionine--tRNA ligase n=1 Tax=Hexamita inflata TaxID=28002 RepID=A0AA86UDM7_9EUKA|nr:Methionyl-tRNA synthetase [Hexamita inflata]
MSKPYYITTPIYYVNGVPHIGHIYTTTLTDCQTLYQRFKGVDAFMLTGCDEHGMKVQTTAENNGVTPQQWCDQVAEKFKQCFTEFGLTNYNRFIRTSDEDHIKAAQNIWSILDKNGYIYKARYEGWYNVSDECFVTDTNLKDGVNKKGEACKVTIDGDVPCVWHSEENYMFKLTAFKDKLLEFYEQNPSVIVPSFRQQEIIQFLQTGLQDLSISRSKAKIHWGIEVPNDADHTMYVWIDALTNYLTGAGWPAENKLWPADVHVIGKDIIRFHCVYWPAFLMGAGIELPKKFFVHGWWVAADNRKIGKSLGNASSPQEMAQKFGLDALRYYMLSEATPESDCQISDDLVVVKSNADLANALGNLLNRCVMSKILPDQIVPKHEIIDKLIKNEAEIGPFETQLKDLVANVNKLFGLVDASMENLRTKDSLLAIMAVVYQINSLLQVSEPWKLIKSSTEQHSLIMYTAIEAMRIVGTLLLPFLPIKAPVILRQLGIPESDWKINAKILTFGYLQQGVPIGTEKGILFQRIEMEKVEPVKPEPKPKKEPKEKKEKKPKAENAEAVQVKAEPEKQE